MVTLYTLKINYRLNSGTSRELIHGITRFEYDGFHLHVFFDSASPIAAWHFDVPMDNLAGFELIKEE